MRELKFMTEPKIKLRLDKTKKALKSLENAALTPPTKNRINVDATIQRFEFTIELFWNLLKAILEDKGVEAQYPKDVLRESFRGNLIDDEKIWIKMLKDRNSTSHTYDEELADEIYARIKTYLPIFKKTLARIAKDHRVAIISANN